MDGPGFITVRYGDNQQQIFNSGCPCLTLLKTLQKKCLAKKDPKLNEEEKGTTTITLDLVDLKGAVINLREHTNMQDYAHNYIGSRETYVLIKIEIDGEEDEYITYTPLLENIEKFYPNVQAKLESLSKRRPVLTTKGGRWAAIKTVTRLAALGKKVGVTQAAPEKKTNSRKNSFASTNSEGDRKNPGKVGRTKIKK